MGPPNHAYPPGYNTTLPAVPPPGVYPQPPHPVYPHGHYPAAMNPAMVPNVRPVGMPCGPPAPYAYPMAPGGYPGVPPTGYYPGPNPHYSKGSYPQCHYKGYPYGGMNPMAGGLVGGLTNYGHCRKVRLVTSWTVKNPSAPSRR
uniref:Uncharacterized protein n=1 Tax=Echeneis naucrates TaxID=173247 RepID=A0A665TCB0_ECHNA